MDMQLHNIVVSDTRLYCSQLPLLPQKEQFVNAATSYFLTLQLPELESFYYEKASLSKSE